MPLTLRHFFLLWTVWHRADLRYWLYVTDSTKCTFWLTLLVEQLSPNIYSIGIGTYLRGTVLKWDGWAVPLFWGKCLCISQFLPQIDEWVNPFFCSLCSRAKLLPRDAMLSAVYATLIPSVCPSRVYCIKTAERIIEILSPSDRPIILVFRHQGLLRKSQGVTPNGGAKYKG